LVALPICFTSWVTKALMVIFETKVEGVSAVQLHRFARRAQALAKVAGEVDVLVSSNRRLRQLNSRFRRKDRPTDVLSFARNEGGDIAISADIACENAVRYGHGVAQELKVLVLHGLLHLAGYDHELDNGRMARAEARLRARLGLKDSLIERASVNGREAASPRRSVTAARRRSKPAGSRSAR
jgi:probable rRNA maturation factor